MQLIELLCESGEEKRPSGDKVDPQYLPDWKKQQRSLRENNQNGNPSRVGSLEPK
jgi:hypothetical protein